MTPSETRSLAGATVLLLVASVVRFAVELRAGDPFFPDMGPDVAPELLEASREERRERERRERPLAPGETLDPNRAEAPELTRLPGVGPAVARALVEERNSGGPFRGEEDLTRVRGIGPATARRIAPHLDFSEAPASASRIGRSDGLRGAAGEPSGVPLGGEEGPRVDVNRAAADELEALPGIGPVLARRIVEMRRARGGFRAPEELREVQGIGPAVLERIRPHLAPFR